MKLINGFVNLFKTYLTMLTQKARNNNKPLNLQARF